MHRSRDYNFSIFAFTTTYILFTICFSYITRINKNESNKPDLQVKVNPKNVTEASLWNDRYISCVVLWTVPALGRVMPQYFPILWCDAEGPSYICKLSKLHCIWFSISNCVNVKIMNYKCKKKMVYSTVQIQLCHGKDNLHLIEVMMTMSALY